jgi:cation:H+ antiporter
LGGILVLFAGGELFVAGVPSLALALAISKIVTGLSVVSLGTNAPEVFMRLLAAIQGRDEVDLAASHGVGSTILVVLGPSAVMLPLLQVFLVESMIR